MCQSAIGSVSLHFMEDNHSFCPLDERINDTSLQSAKYLARQKDSWALTKFLHVHTQVQFIIWYLSRRICVVTGLLLTVALPQLSTLLIHVKIYHWTVHFTKFFLINSLNIWILCHWNVIILISNWSLLCIRKMFSLGNFLTFTVDINLSYNN